MALQLHEPIRRRNGYLLVRSPKQRDIVDAGPPPEPPLLLADATMVATARLAIAATLANTTAAATLASTAIGVPGLITGTLSRTLANATLVSTATYGAVTTQYARIVILETWGAPTALIGLVEFVDGATVKTGTPIFSSEAGSMYAAANAFDADANSYWTAGMGDTAPSIGLQFPAPVTLSTLRVTFRTPDSPDFQSAPRSFRLDFSNNGTDWTPQFTVYNEPRWANNEQRSYVITEAPAGPIAATLARTLANATLSSTATQGAAGGTTAYARVVITETWGAPAVNLGLIEFVDGATVRTGTAVFSSESGEMYSAAKAFDADANSFWVAGLGDTAPSIGLQFSSPTALSAVRLTFRSQDAPAFDSAPRSFRVEFSDNGVDWATKLTVTNAPRWTSGEQRSYTIP